MNRWLAESHSRLSEKVSPTATVLARVLELIVELEAQLGSVQRLTNPCTFSTSAGFGELPSRYAWTPTMRSPIRFPGAAWVPSLIFCIKSRAGRARVAAPVLLASHVVMARSVTVNDAAILFTLAE